MESLVCFPRRLGSLSLGAHGGSPAALGGAIGPPALGPRPLEWRAAHRRTRGALAILVHRPRWPGRDRRLVEAPVPWPLCAARRRLDTGAAGEPRGRRGCRRSKCAPQRSPGDRPLAGDGIRPAGAAATPGPHCVYCEDLLTVAM